MSTALKNVKLSPCPQPGSGVHTWTYAAACRCFEFKIPADDAVELITSQMTRDPTPWCEVSVAVQNAYARLGDGTVVSQMVRQPSWPQVDNEARRSTAKNGGRFALRDLSPVGAQFLHHGGKDWLAKLFRPQDFLCCASAPWDFATRRLEDWPSLGEARLVVPNPMTGALGVSCGGKQSAHTLDNTGARRFLVVEQDVGDLDCQSGVILELLKTAPLSLVLHSGGKSLHSWFFCQGYSEEQLEVWFRRAVALGADPRMWSRCQFARLPGAIRENGQVQRVIFFNPRTIPQP